MQVTENKENIKMTSDKIVELLSDNNLTYKEAQRILYIASKKLQDTKINITSSEDS